MKLRKRFVAFLFLVAAMASTSWAEDSYAWKTLRRMKAEDCFADPMQLNLAKAIARGDSPEILKLIKSGANVNAVGLGEMRPLLWAMARDNPVAYGILIQNRADPNVVINNLVKGEGAHSVMDLAAVAESTEYLRLALENGGDVNFPLGKSRTVIYQAIMHNRIHNVRLLGKHGANLSHQDMAGESPLSTAAMINAYDIVYSLLEMGANPSLKDKWGFDLAALMKKFGTRGIAPNSEQYQWYQKVTAELRKRKLLD